VTGVQTCALPISQSGAAAIIAADPNAPAPPLTTAQQLENAQSQLAAARLKFLADHPDIRALERTVAELQTKVREEAKHPIPTEPSQLDASPGERARLKRLHDLQADVAVIDHQLATSEAEESKLKARMADYQSKVDAAPTRESELVELTRDYSTLQTAYTSLLTKREDSKIAADLERQQIGEQFRILDPASLPEKPYNQMQRLAMIGAGAIGGLVLGLLIIAALELADSSFLREEDVVRTLSLPVLAVVPVLGLDRDRRLDTVRAVAKNAVASLALIASVAIVVWWRLHR